MTTYSVHSINTSGDRTKANYLTNMMAEDVIGHRDVNTSGVQNFSEYLSENQPNLNFCDDPSSSQANANAGNVYGGNNLDGALMKANKWTAIFNNKDYLNCKGKNERRSFRMFMLSGTGMNDALENPNINDEIMYIGRIQMSLNDGKKKVFIFPIRLHTKAMITKYSKNIIGLTLIEILIGIIITSIMMAAMYTSTTW